MKKCIFSSCQPKCDLYWPDAGTETHGDMCGLLFHFKNWSFSPDNSDEKESRYDTNFVTFFVKLASKNSSKCCIIFFSLFQPKCDLYWPDAGTETYGDMCVSLLREDILASYTLRTFSVRYMKPNGTVSKKEMTTLERTVYQYHFTAWPDHGVPLHALPLVSFVRNSAAANALDAGPIVVHCRYFFLDGCTYLLFAH